MPIPQEVSELIKRFDRNRESYRSSEYNETQARREFINPLFKALGWDIDNEQGYAEAYKDVVHEDAIKIGGATKAPDYSSDCIHPTLAESSGASTKQRRKAHGRQIQFRQGTTTPLPTSCSSSARPHT